MFGHRHHGHGHGHGGGHGHGHGHGHHHHHHGPGSSRESFGEAWREAFGGSFRGPFGGSFGGAFFGPRFHHGRGGHWGGHGGGGKGWGRHFGPPGARFGRGDLKYVMLDLLKDGPRHGYDVIRALEERFHGFYSPSPGSVYPTLQLLEDQGYLRSSEQDGKRVYTITDEGRAFLAERAETVEDVHERAAAGWGPLGSPEMGELMGEVRQLGQFIFHQGRRGALGDPNKVRQLRDVVARARVEIEGIFSREEPTSV